MYNWFLNKIQNEKNEKTRLIELIEIKQYQ